MTVQKECILCEANTIELQTFDIIIINTPLILSVCLVDACLW